MLDSPSAEVPFGLVLKGKFLAAFASYYVPACLISSKRDRKQVCSCPFSDGIYGFRCNNKHIFTLHRAAFARKRQFNCSLGSSKKNVSITHQYERLIGLAFTDILYRHVFRQIFAQMKASYR